MSNFRLAQYGSAAYSISKAIDKVGGVLDTALMDDEEQRAISTVIFQCEKALVLLNDVMKRYDSEEATRVGESGQNASTGTSSEPPAMTPAVVRTEESNEKLWAEQDRILAEIDGEQVSFEGLPTTNSHYRMGM